MQEHQSQYPARDMLSPTDYVMSFISTFEQRCADYEDQLALVTLGSKNRALLRGVTHQERLQIWDRMIKRADPTGRQHDTAQPVADPAPTKLLITPKPSVTGRYNHHVIRGTIRPVYVWIQRPYATEDKLAVSLALQQQRIGLRVAAEQEKMKQAAGRWVSPKSKHNLNTYASDLLRRSVVPQLRHDR